MTELFQISPKHTFKIGKIWQGEQPFVVFAASVFNAADLGVPKKCFLIADSRQANFGFQVAFKKPDQLKVGSSGLAALLRKYLADVKIISGYQNPESGDQVLELEGKIPVPQSKAAEFVGQAYLWLARRRPPELSLTLDSGEQIFRYGQKGFFNKVKRRLDVEERFLKQEFTDWTPLQFACPADSSPEMGDQTHEVIPGVSDSSMVSSQQRSLKQKISRRMKTLRKSMQQQRELLEQSERGASLLEQAKLLQSFIFKVQPGDLELKLDVNESGVAGGICIELDPELSPAQNLESMFKSAKKSRRTQELGSERFLSLESQLLKLQDIHSKLAEIAKDVDGVRDVQQRAIELGVKLDLAEKSQSSQLSKVSRKPSASFRVIKVKDGVEFLIGRSPAENDELTKKANSADFWFHVTAGGGSHVLLPRGQLKKQGLKKPTAEMIRIGGILAVHFSGFKTDCCGEIYFTQKRNLRKTKGLAPGLWLVDRSQVLYIKYSEQERDNVFLSV